MYRRYIIVGIVFFLLIGAYFVFFDGDKNKEYEKIYEKLVDRDNYADSLEGITLSVDEIEEEHRYNYIVTLDNVSEKVGNVKVLVVDADCSKDDVKSFPSFGIIDNKGYSIIPSNEQKDEKEIKGINLTIVDSEKIENLLVYFASDDGEQFVRINVSSYLN